MKRFPSFRRCYTASSRFDASAASQPSARHRSPSVSPSTLTLVSLWLVLIAGYALADAGPVIKSDGPSADDYGKAAGYPPAPLRGTINRQAVMVGSYSHFDQVFPAAVIAASASPSSFHRAADDLALTYTYQGQPRSLAAYLADNPTTGLLIVRDDTILSEHYQYARTPADRFLSQSMAKTVTALLIGTAIADGSIHSVDDPAGLYVRELSGTELGSTSIRDLLHMSSGLAFSETYDGSDDNAALGRALFSRAGPSPEAAVAQFDHRVAPAGTMFHYAGRDTETLGLVLAHATGQSLAHLLEEHIWRPMGAEASATWTVDHTGRQIAYCCLSATLRDWARLGLLVARKGEANGRQIVPAAWIREATRYEPGSPFAPDSGRRWGYGYQIWLLPSPPDNVAFVGIHGQRIFVDPASKLVLVHTAVRTAATGNTGDAELAALWRALVRQVGQ